MSRLEQLSIYLLKTTVVNATDAIRQGATFSTVALPATAPDNAVLLTRATPPHAPNWARFFPPATQIAINALLSASAGAILLVPVRGRWFALCFGTGWHLLRKDAFVRSFGLKAALSLVKADTLKAVDVSTYDNFAKHRRVSTSRGTTIDSFDIEGQLDLLRGVIGDCGSQAVAQQIGGRDACILWTRVEFDRLPKLCSVLLTAYESDRVSKRFPVVNNVSEVRDPSEEARLDGLLDAALAANPNHDVTIAPPEVVDWQNVQAFSLDHANAPGQSLSFSLADIRNMLHPNPVTCAQARAITQTTVDPNGNPGHQSWSLYDCIVTEIDDPTDLNVRCILLAGDWYVVAASFVGQVNAGLAAVPTHATALPNALVGETEGAYNRRFAGMNPASRALLDAKNISYGGGSSRIEVCDVITSASLLYHIKDYHGSATLSHLFSQGTVSSRLLLEQDFRQKIINKYPALPGGVIQVGNLNAGGFEIVYGIICEPTRALPGGLPFFSKVRLLEAVRELKRMGFVNVSIAKISR